MAYFKNLTTSERISLSFAFFGFISLLMFLILINITYFLIWYNEQKELSFQDMSQDYSQIMFEGSDDEKIDDFTNFLLTQNTIIIPDEGELICSPGVAKKIRQEPEQLKNNLFYRDNETIYFIYSKYFSEVGEVKVFFDTTEYINTQLIIIRISLIFIGLMFILQFFAGKFLGRKLLKNLKHISKKVQEIDIHSKQQSINLENVPENDEIRILANALNNSYTLINEQTGKLKQFLTDVSHEFKTPLMAMNSRLDVLEKKSEKKFLTVDDSTDFLRLARKNIHTLNGLLESLFFLSRMEENKGCLVRKNLKMQEYIEKKLLRIAESFPHKKLEYTLNISHDLKYLVEENTFSILLDNLISNAMKFSPENMHITIQADKTSFSIRDNGPGIPSEKREKIWEKFYRLDTNKEGFGVGLYIVKRIVDMYEWSIFVSSENNKGTTFKINIR